MNFSPPDTSRMWVVLEMSLLLDSDSDFLPIHSDPFVYWRSPHKLKVFVKLTDYVLHTKPCLSFSSRSLTRTAKM